MTGDKSSTIGVNCGLATGRSAVVSFEPGIASREGGYIYEGVSGTLRANAGDNQMATAYAVEPILIHDQATRFADKHGDKSDGKGNGLGVGNPGDPMNTLTGGDRHAVVYACSSKQQSLTVTEGKANTLGANDYKEPQIIALDRASFNQGKNALYDPQTYEDGTNPTIVARGPSAVCYKKPPRYIVRRLTPTECARLQGFPDLWGHPDKKTEFTDEEYRFWLEVRNTHAAINGKAVKDYTKTQMLTWYSKLHTDSSEYKMWGNGIALPCALYVMEGIVEVATLPSTSYHSPLKSPKTPHNR